MKKANQLLAVNVLFMCLLTLVLLGSCKKLEPGVIENNYSGAVLVTSSGSNPAGDFTGDGDSGSYSFAFDNPKTKVQVNFDITTPTGSVRIVIEDKKGKTVLDQTLSGGSGTDTFSGLSSEGKKGVWKVTLTLTNFDGDGSYSINPA